MKTNLLPIIVTIFLNGQLFSQSPGTLDLSFGEGGKLFIECGGPSEIQDVEVLQDGRILLAGKCTDNLASMGLLVMVNPDGSIDAGFGSDGFVYVSFDGYSQAEVNVIEVAYSPGNDPASDYSIYAGVKYGDFEGPYFGSIGKFDNSGQVLQNYAQDGWTNKFELSVNQGIRIDEAENLYSASTFKNTTGPDLRGKIFLRKYTPAGIPDPVFGISGVIEIADESGNDFDYIAGGIDTMSLDRIAIFGYQWEGLDQEPLAIVINADGTFDMSFGSGGIYLGDFNTSFVISTGHNLGVDTLALGGPMFNLNTGSWEQGLLKLRPTGVPDINFGINGVANHLIDDDEPRSFVPQPIGNGSKALINGGFVYYFNKSSRDWETTFFLTKFLPDGFVDVTFGEGGSVITDFGNGWNVANVIRLQADGKILAGGFADNGEMHTMVLARYHNDLNVSVTEEVSSKITIYPNPASDQVSVLIGGNVGDRFSIQLVNLLGELLYHEDLELRLPSETIAINMEHLAPGLYTVIVRNDQSAFIENLVLER